MTKDKTKKRTRLIKDWIKRKSVRSEQQYKNGAEPRWEGPVGFFVKEWKCARFVTTMVLMFSVLTLSIQNAIAELYSLLETVIVVNIIIIMRLRIGVVV